MQSTIKWVVGLIGVSSTEKAKIFSFVFVLFFLVISSFSCRLPDAVIASDITSDSIVALTNKSRSMSAHPPLRLNEKLSQAAKTKAEDMMTNNYFSHTSPSGITPWAWIDRANYDYYFAGENLAMDFHSAEKMEEAWMASPTHRENILNDKYHDVGVAIKEGTLNGHNTLLVVVMFGSGDKNLSSENNVKKEMPAPEKKKSENIIPVLPAGEARQKIAFPQWPIITSPQSGEMFSASETKIIGRAKPGETVSIFDNGKLEGSALTNADGWFGFLEKNLSQGNHQLSVRDEKALSEASAQFFVDQKKPEVDFRLYANKDIPQHFFLEAKADESNCLIQIDGEKRKTIFSEKVVFLIDANQASAILRISDKAGNKNFRQVNIANYYIPEYPNNFSKKIAEILTPRENLFAADSGREAVKNNLGLAPRQFLASGK